MIPPSFFYIAVPHSGKYAARLTASVSGYMPLSIFFRSTDVQQHRPGSCKVLLLSLIDVRICEETRKSYPFFFLTAFPESGFWAWRLRTGLLPSRL